MLRRSVVSDFFFWLFHCQFVALIQILKIPLFQRPTTIPAGVKRKKETFSLSHFPIIKKSIQKSSLIHAFCDNYFYTIANIKELSKRSLALQTAQRIRHCK